MLRKPVLFYLLHYFRVPPKQIDTSKTEYSYHNLGCPNDVHINLDAAGGEVFVTGGQEIVFFFNGSAAYNSELFLHQPTKFIGQQNHTLDGTQTSLGFFPKVKTCLFLYVPETEHTFYSGPASANPDDIVHAESPRQTQIFGTEALKT